jgi:glutamate-1-semialdehyde 2,1-aminomutase
MRSYRRSGELFERAKKSLAGGVSSEFRKFNQPHPLFITRALGARIVDADENEYIDFSLSQGPAILGHSHPEVQAAVQAAGEGGQITAAIHLREVELAETLQRLIPCAERIRFSVTGSEADHTALRIARGVTGRQKFVRFEGHYHGWFDNVAHGIGGSAEQIGPREAPNAVPWSQGLSAHSRDEFILLPWNDLPAVERAFATHGSEIAAVITEPVMCNTGCIEPEPGFLRGLRELCTRSDSALIFDEVITGFRIALGGAQAHYGVTPDLAVFAKAMANGYPISAICGTERWMRPVSEGKVVHAGTVNAGNPSVAAALATITIMERERVHARLHALGQRLKAGLRAAANEAGQPLLLQGPGPMLHMAFTAQAKAIDYRDALHFDRAKLGAFVTGMQDRGIRLLSRGLWYVSAAMTEADIDAAVAAARECLQAADG